MQRLDKTRAIGINRFKFHEPLAGRHIFVFIGAINPDKNPLIQAALRLLLSEDSRFDLVHVASDCATSLQ